MPLKQRPPLLAKRNPLVMIFLLGNVVIHLIEIRYNRTYSFVHREEAPLTWCIKSGTVTSSGGESNKWTCSR